MKKLSFLELEKEMQKANRLITNKNVLKAIEGGMRHSNMRDDLGLLTNNDQFSFASAYYSTTYLPTTTIPINQNQMDLWGFLFNNFSVYPSNTEFLATEGDSNIPPGYNTVTDTNSPYYGKYTSTDQNGNIQYSNAVTMAGYKNGEWITEIFISPDVMDNFSDEERFGTVGHEMIHANNIAAHTNMYQNDIEQFQKNSEYAAWKFEYYYYAQKGDNEAAIDAWHMMQKYEEEGADTTWDYTLPDFPLTTDPVGNSATTTSLPTSTVPVTTI